MLFKPTGTDPGHPQIHSYSALIWTIRWESVGLSGGASKILMTNGTIRHILDGVDGKIISTRDIGTIM